MKSQCQLKTLEHHLMSQTFYKKGFLALAVATALGVSAFAQADIKIGVAGPMTGANAAFGEQYMKGAQAAADAVNAAGGVNGEKSYWSRAMTPANRNRL
jgi:branched-chain amino acid transport system substrate-binding protein